VLPRGGSASVTLHLEPAPRVAVRAIADGRAASGARMRLVAGDVPNATLALVRNERPYLDDEVRRHLPATVQNGVADAAGEVVFTDHGDLVGARTVEAWSEDGSRYAIAAVPPGVAEVELRLEPAAKRHDAVLELALSARTQGLPVELVIAGRPEPRFVVEPRDNLSIRGLEPGRWRIEATWWGERVLRIESLEVRTETRIPVALPQGAVDGQDEDTWQRAGEEYPRG
jgi:transposase